MVNMRDDTTFETIDLKAKFFQNSIECSWLYLQVNISLWFGKLFNLQCLDGKCISSIQLGRIM